MRNLSFIIRKWGVRAMVAVGAAVGLTSCSHRIGHNPAEAVYGPPPDTILRGIKVIEDVYGPPVERTDSTSDNAEPEPIGTDFENDEKEVKQ